MISFQPRNIFLRPWNLLLLQEAFSVRISSSQLWFLKVRMKRFSRVFVHEKTAAMTYFIHPQAVFPPFVFLGHPSSMAAWHGDRMGGRGQWHQRTDIKSQARLDVATIVRCGHSPTCPASRSCKRTVTGAASWLTLDIRQLGGQIKDSFTNNFVSRLMDTVAWEGGGALRETGQ